MERPASHLPLDLYKVDKSCARWSTTVSCKSEWRTHTASSFRYDIPRQYILGEKDERIYLAVVPAHQARTHRGKQGNALQELFECRCHPRGLLQKDFPQIFAPGEPREPMQRPRGWLQAVSRGQVVMIARAYPHMWGSIGKKSANTLNGC